MSDIYSDSVYVQIKLLCKKRFPSPLNTHSDYLLTYVVLSLCECCCSASWKQIRRPIVGHTR